MKVGSTGHKEEKPPKSKVRLPELRRVYYEVSSAIFNNSLSNDKTDLITIFFEAVKNGDLERVKNFLQRKGSPIDIDTKEKKTGNTPIMYAVMANNLPMVKLLLRYGADTTLRNAEQETIFDKSKIDMKGYLLGPSTKKLLQSAWQGNAEIVRKILSSGKAANINGKNSEGCTPLLLVTRDIKMFTEVNQALQRDYKPVEVVTELLQYSAETSIRDVNGYTPLHHAAAANNDIATTIICLLLDKAEANIDIADNRNYSPLHHASKSGHVAAVNTLVEKGANVNARSDQGETPLHLSASGGHEIVSTTLLNNGADITLVDNDGLTPVDVAKTSRLKAKLRDAWAEQTYLKVDISEPPAENNDSITQTDTKQADASTSTSVTAKEKAKNGEVENGSLQSPKKQPKKIKKTKDIKSTPIKPTTKPIIESQNGFRLISFDRKRLDQKNKSCEGRIQSTKTLSSCSSGYKSSEKNKNISRSVSLQGTWTQKVSHQSDSQPIRLKVFDLSVSGNNKNPANSCFPAINLDATVSLAPPRGMRGGRILSGGKNERKKTPSDSLSSFHQKSAGQSRQFLPAVQNEVPKPSSAIVLPAIPDRETQGVGNESRRPHIVDLDYLSSKDTETSQTNQETNGCDGDISTTSKSYSDNRVGINTIDCTPVELSNTDNSLQDSPPSLERHRSNRRGRLNPLNQTDQDHSANTTPPEMMDASSSSSLSWSLNDSPASLVIDCSDDREEATPPSKPDVTDLLKLNLSMRPRNLSSISERNESDSERISSGLSKSNCKDGQKKPDNNRNQIRYEKLSTTDSSAITSTTEHSETDTTLQYESSDATVTTANKIKSNHDIIERNGVMITENKDLLVENNTTISNHDHSVNGLTSDPSRNELNIPLDPSARVPSKNSNSSENTSELPINGFNGLSSQHLSQNGSKRGSMDSEFTSRSYNSSSVTGYKGSSETSNDSIDDSNYKTRSSLSKVTKQRVRKAPFPLHREDSFADDEMSNYTSGQSRRTSELSCISQEAIDDLTRSGAKSVAAQIENLSKSNLPVIHTVLDSGSHRLSICSSFNGISSDIDDPDAQRISWKKGQILGKGGFGVVVCGLTNDGQQIAVKQVSLDDKDIDSAVKVYENLRHEIKMLKNLRHHNIVHYLGMALENDTVNIFMELVTGGTIANVIKNFGPLDEKIFSRYTMQILQGLKYVHDRNIIHRDIKGSNVMLMPSGVIKLIDFGCSKADSHSNNNNTGSPNNSVGASSIKGTPYWMAPEVVKQSVCGCESDIWSTGCTVFEMATGKPPWAEFNKLAALYKIGSDTEPPQLSTDLFSEDCVNFVKSCLTRDPKARPSATQLLRLPFVVL
ncbi:Mitogen-activated protein kinase kinase kinase 19 [Trichoplax sp. H2]|nr:Mitogen-activated protein kinase kinase kinase 19 [Trichoplax sp. H2]|eukprot:RDD44652.1 Mitogen-activated protein kinase kinase kinase 19 [Trichoplax sp. H2]